MSEKEQSLSVKIWGLLCTHWTGMRWVGYPHTTIGANRGFILFPFHTTVCGMQIETITYGFRCLNITFIKLGMKRFGGILRRWLFIYLFFYFYFFFASKPKYFIFIDISPVMSEVPHIWTCAKSADGRRSEGSFSFQRLTCHRTSVFKDIRRLVILVHKCRGFGERENLSMLIS